MVPDKYSVWFGKYYFYDWSMRRRQIIDIRVLNIYIWGGRMYSRRISILIFVTFLFSSFVATSYASKVIEVIQVDIQPQPLSKAIQTVAKQYDFQIAFFPEVMEGIKSPAISGSYTMSQILDLLLAKTSLDHKFVGDKSVVIVPRGKTTLDDKYVGTKSEVTSLDQREKLDNNKQRVPSATKNVRSKLEEITVTARKRNESIQDVPISIVALSAAEIESRSLSSLRDLGQFVTNVSYFQNGQVGNGSAAVFIRGVGQFNVFPTRDPGVGIYLDGVFLGRMQGVDLDLTDVERVEVLRGPQGTLFGKNTTGGAINIVTAKPDLDGFSGSAEVIFGRYDRIDGRLGVNVPLVPGKLGAKLAVSSRNQDGYGRRLDFTTGDTLVDAGDVDRVSTRGSLYWTPTEDFNALLSFNYARHRETGAPRKIAEFITVPTTFVAQVYNNFLNPDYGPAFTTSNNFDNFATGTDANDVDAWGTSLTLSWDIGSLNLKSISAYRDNDSFVGVDPDGTPHRFIDSANTFDFDQISQEIQLGGLAFNDRLNWVTGLFYFEEDNTENSTTEFAVEVFQAIGLEVPANDIEQTDTTSESIAVFGQGTFSLTKQLSLTAGVRYTDEEKSFERSSIASLSGVPLPGIAKKKASFDAVTGRVGAVYRFNEDVMVYASLSEGFLSGGINVSAQAAPPFKPEKLTSYEVGLKSEYFDKRLRFNSAFFYSDYKDIQFSIISVLPGTLIPIRTIGNAAKAEVWGFEMDASAVPLESIILSAGIGHIDAKYEEVDSSSGITTDTDFALTPKWSATLSGTYEMPLGSGGDIKANVSYSYKSQIEHNIPNNPFIRQDGYGLVNVRLIWISPGSDWEVAVFGTNLTDEEYLQATTNFAGLGFIDAQFATPREWGVSAKWLF